VLPVVALAGGVFALYAVLALRIAEGTYLEHFNLLFDLDSEAYATTLTRPLAELFEPHFGILKHPLVTWLALLARPWLALGFEAPAAAGLTTASAATAAVVLCWATLRVAGARAWEATLGAAVFALGAAQLFNGFLTESYPFAALTIAAILYFGFRRIRAPGTVAVPFALVAVAAFGVTITNAAQAGIVDLVGRLRAAWPALATPGRGRALRAVALDQARFAAACALVAAALVGVTWWGPLLAAAAEPIATLKQLYWVQTKGETTGIGPVLLGFFGFAFAAPDFTLVDLPEHVMRDFRHYDMSGLGAALLPAWIVLWAGAAVLALRAPTTRPYALAALGCIVFNVLLHLEFQFRFSVFLYAGHVWPAVAVVFGLGLIALRERCAPPPRLVAAAVALLVVAAAANNAPRAWAAATAFDTYPPFDRPPLADLPATGVVRAGEAAPAATAEP
jgi:hypothetical protein